MNKQASVPSTGAAKKEVVELTDYKVIEEKRSPLRRPAELQEKQTAGGLDSATGCVGHYLLSLLLATGVVLVMLSEQWVQPGTETPEQIKAVIIFGGVAFFVGLVGGLYSAIVYISIIGSVVRILLEPASLYDNLLGNLRGVKPHMYAAGIAAIVILCLVGYAVGRGISKLLFRR